ncbi:MAG TPA: TonB-dependent receptor [Steroidobacteraceae bacterium]|nr:TonB-dependent receptor [Steroidobacteraceae bacterium]
MKCGNKALRQEQRIPLQSNLVGMAVAAVLAGVPLSVPTSARAQDQSPAPELEEVTVTGSRIVRRDLVSNSPLVTVDTATLENKSGVNIESYLNQLPQYNPAASPVTTQFDVQISPVNSVGVSTISLRGFGPNRSLTLVNGHRMTPINALMWSDINGIPSYLIKRVETITGGASAVYGADAMGGVTNFILRDDFQGAEADIQRTELEAGDGAETRGYAMLGTNVADGRGNITIGAEYYRRGEALRRNRDFYTDAWSDPWTPTADLFVFGYNGYNTGFFNAPSGPALSAVFQSAPGQSQCAVSSVNCNILQGFRFNTDGTMFNLSGNNLQKFLDHGGVIDGRKYAIQKTYDTTTLAQGQLIDTLKWNNEEGLIESPQTRYSFFGSGKWSVTDDVSFFARVTYAESKTSTRLIPTNASFGWEAQVPYNPTTDSPILPTLDPSLFAAAIADPTNPAYANPSFIAHGQPGAQHPVPVEMAVLLNSRPNPAASWIAETYPDGSFPQRATLNTNNVWQIETGFDFKLPVKDWTGEFYWSRGQSSTYNVAIGDNSLTRWRALVSAPDYGRNSRLFGNANGASPNFGTVPVPCTSGFYETLFFGDAVPSDDCRYAAEAPLQARTQNQQDIGELTFQGGLFNGWAGEWRGALGVQYRKNAVQFNPDILQSTASFTDQVIGVYPTGYLDASLNVKDYYGELLVPVLSDLKFLKRFELELGGRESDYSTTGRNFTFKINGNVELNDWVRFRGGFNRAVRAPNLGELYLHLQEIFTADGRFGDPCGVRSNAPFGAGGSGPDPVVTPGETAPVIASGQTAAGAQSTKLICQAQMGAAANQFYNVANAPAAAGGAFAWVYNEGSPDLKPERADTWTAGVVFNSRADSPWLSNLSLALDWWKFDITDAIQQYSIDYARYLCYGTVMVTNPVEAAAQAATEACQNVPRNAGNGNPTTALVRYDNQATIATQGLDLQLNWFATLSDLGLSKVPGRFGVNMQATFLDYYKTKQSALPFDVETDWKGSLGPTLSGTNPGAYSYKLATAFNYQLPRWNFNLRWRHLPSVWPANKATEDAIIKNNERVAAGGDGILLSYTPGTAIKTPSYDQFDFSLTWAMNDKFMVRAGVDNLFDKDPPVVGDNSNNPSAAGARRGYTPEEYPDPKDLVNVCHGAPGCQPPTSYVLPSSGAGFTSPGFYDNLGRRYFVGFKANF